MPAGADDRARREPARVVERAEDDAAADRQDVERRPHRRSPPPPPPRPRRPGRASGPRRAPPARSPAGTPGTGRAAPPRPRTRRLSLIALTVRLCSAASRTRSATVRAALSASSFSITGTPARMRARDDELLQAADVVEALEVARLRPLRVLVAEAEVAHVLVLVLDREHDEAPRRRAPAAAARPSRDEVDALEHERPALLERALGRGARRRRGRSSPAAGSRTRADRRRRGRRRRPRSSTGGSRA